jgi:hypothetical protein
MHRQRRYGGDFWSDLSDVNKWTHELSTPDSNFMKQLQTGAQIASMMGGSKGKRRGGDFWSDLGDVNKWTHELSTPDSNFMKQLQTGVQLAALAGGSKGGKRRGGDFWSDLTDEFTDPRKLMRNAQTARELAKLAGYGYTGGKRTRAPSRRGAIVREIMAQNPGMSLPMASKYVKDNGLYK